MSEDSERMNIKGSYIRPQDNEYLKCLDILNPDNL